MFLFARWLANNYADTHVDDNMKSEYDEGFNPLNSLSVLNRENGLWYIERLKYFNDTVYPNYVKNGTVNVTKQFLSITNVDK